MRKKTGKARRAPKRAKTIQVPDLKPPRGGANVKGGLKPTPPSPLPIPYPL